MVHAKKHFLQGQKLKVIQRKINNISNKKSNKQPSEGQLTFKSWLDD